MSECVQMHQRTCENAEKTEEKLRTFKKLFCPDQETLAPHDYIAGFLFPRTGLTCFFLGAERDGKGVYRRYGEILRPHWHVQTHHRSSKVSLRQKKSRSDFFWRRPCGRSAQTTVRHQRFVYAKKNREAIFFGVDRAAVRRRPPVDVRPSWLA